MEQQRARPFRFALQSRMSDDWQRQARRIEELGYDILLMPDHFGRQFAIGPALAAAAEATTTLRIGTLVLQNDLRHPTMLAMEAATLDVLSGGRFELGIGAGGSYLPDFEWTGIPFDPPGTRVSRLEESIEVLKGLFGPDPFTHSGKYFTIRDFQSMPKPVQQPRLPLLIAGGGNRVLRLAAKHATIVGLLPRMVPEGGSYDMNDISLEGYAAKTKYVLDHAGDRGPDLEFNILIQQVIVTDDREAEIARLKREGPHPTDAWFDSPMVYVGSVEEIVAKLRHIREATGASYFAVFELNLETFAPIVAELAGR
jgi:probable F420-dependent oxidoreductase